MEMRQVNHWESIFCEHLAEQLRSSAHLDASHDLAHIKRVVNAAMQICQNEGAFWQVVLPAAWFHDYVIIPKKDPRRAEASRLSAQAALVYLESVHYPGEYFSDIAHAIEAHSFSANIECRSLEAKIVQDADRLDALGAIGLTRLFNTSGQMGSLLYEALDPLATQRELNDQLFALDHIFKKLFPIVRTLKTESGQREGYQRVQFIKVFVDQLMQEIGMRENSGSL